MYVDGLNLYYGSVRGTPYKWLNLEALFKKLRPDYSIQRIYYFTALVDSPHKQVNQLAYLRALNTLPLVKTVVGRFKNKTIKCGVAQCDYRGSRLFTVPEEKRTDVSMAVQMLDDAYQDNMDNVVVVSGDSDLVPALSRIRDKFSEKKIIVYIPSPSRYHLRAAAVEIRGIAHCARELPNLLIQRSQFPKELLGVDGQPIAKPSTW